MASIDALTFDNLLRPAANARLKPVTTKTNPTAKKIKLIQGAFRVNGNCPKIIGKLPNAKMQIINPTQICQLKLRIIPILNKYHFAKSIPQIN